LACILEPEKLKKHKRRTPIGSTTMKVEASNSGGMVISNISLYTKLLKKEIAGDEFVNKDWCTNGLSFIQTVPIYEIQHIKKKKPFNPVISTKNIN
jgi:hypothetical protein